MTVCLTQHDHESIIPLFASCLYSLPNLHTLQLMFVQEHQEMLATLRGAFEGQKYPQIKTIVLPGCAHWVLRACPDVIDVACNDWRNTELLEAIDIQCRQVEVVTGIDVRAHQSSRKSSSLMHVLILNRTLFRQFSEGRCRIFVMSLFLASTDTL